MPAAASLAARYADLSGWARVGVKVAVTLLVAYLLVAAAVYLLQRRLIFPAGRSDARLTAAQYNESGRLSDVTAKTADGLTLHGWLSRASSGPADAPERRAVLYLHGNGGDRRIRLGEMEALNRAGFDVLLFDYRGYGENPGAPSEAGLRRDAAAFWQATSDLGYRPDRVVIAGTSLGGGVATPLAADLCDAGTPPAGLLLRSTFDSMTAAASDKFPWLPVGLLLRDRFESVAAAPRITCPVFQAHGTSDRIVPLPLGERLHAAFPEAAADGTPKRWLALPGVTHNGLRVQGGREYAAAERAFLDAVVPPAG